MSMGGITGGGDEPDDDDFDPVTGGEEVSGSREEHESSDYEEPEYDHTYGYGIFNGVWDLGSAVRRKLAGDEPRYRDDAGRPQSIPSDQEKFGRRAFLGVARDATILGVAGGVAASATSGNRTADNESDVNPVPSENGVVAYGEGDLSVEEGVSILEYLTERTAVEGLPVDGDDVRAYSDGDGVEMAMIEAELEPGKPSDDSYVSIRLERGKQTRTVESGGVDDFAARALTRYPSFDGNVEDYVEEVLED